MTEARAGAEAGRSDLFWYLGSTSAWMAGYQLQTFLIAWVLVGVLARPADEVGFAQFLIGVPGLLLLLFGGARADQIDARSLIVRIHAFLVLPPLLLLGATLADVLSVAVVVAFGMAIAAAGAFADPARAALLNRIGSNHIQRLVGMSMIVTSGVGLLGLVIGGQLERLTLPGVLLLQAGLFALGGLAMLRFPALAVRPPPAPGGTLAQFAAGLRVVGADAVLRNVIGMNFVSGVVNAGAFFVALPFVASALYDGDAGLFSWLLVVFFSGSIASNALLLRFTPLARPGRLFLLMQLTRMVVLALIAVQPALSLLLVAVALWGMNMGITTTLVRSMVQEVAPLEHRGKILAVLILGFTAAQPLGSALLGLVIHAYSPVAGLLPGIVVSLGTFLWGIGATPLWRWRTNAAPGSAVPSDGATPED